MFGANSEGDNPLAGAAMMTVLIPVMLLSEIHDALKSAGHKLADDVFKLIPAPGAHGDK